MGAERRITVVGGVAAGMSAVSQAKRRNPEAHVVVFERGTHISYGACGLSFAGAPHSGHWAHVLCHFHGAVSSE